MTNQAFDLGGVIVATTLAFTEDASAPAGLAVDYDRYAEHCNWLIENGCRGVGPNGSLGEYSSLTDDERRRVVQTAVQAVDGRGLVIAGVHGVGWHQARHWAQLAKDDGADGVLLLPPTLYRASDSEVIEHYTRVAEVGLPIMAYNNPFDTKVDLTPQLLVELAKIPEVVAVKEFTGDIRRVLEIQELTDLDVIAGADDLLFEALVDGAVGWFAGYPNAFPKEAVEIYTLVTEGKIAEARTLYKELVAVFRWDSRTEFVQAIKLSIDIAGQSFGGRTRPPRGPLSAANEAQVRTDTEKALSYLASR
ncbi:dihydrodipicolinate synthase family protein [Subtercola boreus]|uniref:Dihydrodipicolinate synthase family protein n=1 Tax=Subtercola boreus TaxID=120213 RepID=A0A3E0W9C0_9MICO|nr:dihydrodipicolinate synthase family protein [Subtercola boreus]RFA19835.1 dihydrodipicolinate synthase family protein [Subtercola boreus]RFA19902.1 dihydrodipicolinate synthase family protein [Subtercola boreus]RFA26295.1 dihydrodipicolinate synthase family protein [Subtercola boreus]